MTARFAEEIALLQGGPAAQWELRIGLLDQRKNLIMLVRERQICFANEMALSWLGYASKHELLGADLLGLFAADYQELGEVGLDAISGEMIPMKLVRHDGAEIEVELWIDKAETDSEIYVIEARNITEHLRAARALRSREQWLEGIINTVADGIVTVDHRGIVQSFNPAAERIFRFRAQEVIGKSIRELVPMPVDDQSAADQHGIEWTRMTMQGHELMGKRKGGDVFPMEMSIREMLQGDRVSYTGVVRDVTARRRAEEKIRHLAHHDPLTSLPNRFLFKDRLDTAVSRALRHGDRLAVVFIDLNEFKPINDNFGHGAGDAVLIALAKRLTNGLRKSDTVARLGGDEFVIVLEEVRGQEHVRGLLDKVMATITQPFEVDGQELSISASLGVSIFPDHAGSGDQLVEYADRAMYVAKKEGPSFACIYPDLVWKV